MNKFGKKVLIISAVFIIEIFITNYIFASDLEFFEESLQNREDVRETNKYQIKDSLIDEYDVDNIFTDEKSSMEGIYTAEDLFNESSQEVSLVTGEFEDIFVNDAEYHEEYAASDSSTIFYKVIIIISIVVMTYFLTNLYILFKARRKNAKI